MNNLQPYQKRMIEERDQLSTRIEGLSAFIDTGTFDALDDLEKGRLREQRRFMVGYLETLKARIAAW